MKDTKVILEKNIKLVCEIWSSILNKKVLPSDNLVEIGISSLDATKFVATLKKKYNIDIKLKSIFTSKSVIDFVETYNFNLKNNCKETIEEGEI